MQKKILYIFSFSILSYLVYLFSNYSNNDEKNKKNECLTTTLVDDTDIIKIETPPADSSTTIETKQHFETSNITNTNHECHGFEELEIEDMPNNTHPRKNIEPVILFKIKQNLIKNLLIGDFIDLPEINQIPYTGKVIQKKNNNNGSTTVITTLEGEESKYYAVMTEGEKTSFISIFSPYGNYELNSINGYGYGYSSEDIRNSMTDYSKPDVIRTKKD